MAEVTKSLIQLEPRIEIEQKTLQIHRTKRWNDMFNESWNVLWSIQNSPVCMFDTAQTEYLKNTMHEKNSLHM